VRGVHARFLVAAALVAAALTSAPAQSKTVSEETVHEVAGRLRCVVCQNLSVADSPSEMAGQMRAIIRERLAAHLADPAVAAAAPRIAAVPAGPDWAGRYTTAACCLDLGDAEARVAPGTRVAYVPTAALVARRAALAGRERSWRRVTPMTPTVICGGLTPAAVAETSGL